MGAHDGAGAYGDLGAYYIAGRVVGALIGILLAKSLFRWLFKRRLGDGEALVLVSVLAALVLAVVLRGWSFAGDGSPRFDLALQAYLPAAVIWLLIDLFALKRRRSRARERGQRTAAVFADNGRDHQAERNDPP